MQVIEQHVQRRGLSDGGIAAFMFALVCGLGAAVAQVAFSDATLTRNLSIAAAVLMGLSLVLRRVSRTRLTVRHKDGRVLLWVGNLHEKGPFVLQAGRRKSSRNDGPHALFLVVQKAGRDLCQFAELARGEAPESFAPGAMPPRVPAYYLRSTEGSADLRQLREALEAVQE